MNTLVIAVAYRTPQEAVGFAKSLLAGYGGPDLHLIIVDNSDVAGEAVRQDDLPSGDGRVELVLAPANLGYFGGAELGLATHLRRHEWPDWVVVCNVDLTVEDPAGLLERLRSAKATSVVAPRIIREDTGRDLNPFMRTRPAA
ncbi:MAG TPA: hypothetical protein VFI92_13850, partial [Steroidobacteraceae bacterium]|nr:hypothetical protein [Steroidobacteraceae bacterium]